MLAAMSPVEMNEGLVAIGLTPGDPPPLWLCDDKALAECAVPNGCTVAACICGLRVGDGLTPNDSTIIACA